MIYQKAVAKATGQFRRLGRAARAAGAGGKRSSAVLIALDLDSGACQVATFVQGLDVRDRFRLIQQAVEAGDGSTFRRLTEVFSGQVIIGLLALALTDLRFC